jgi:carbon starvation protein
MFILGYSNAFSVLWPIFGAANQLLAALALITVSSWLVLKGKKYFFALFPALFMLATTITALVMLFIDYLNKMNYILMLVDILLLVLSGGVAVLAFKTFVKRGKNKEMKPDLADAVK